MPIFTGSKGNILIKGIFFLLIFAAGFFIFYKSPLKNNIVELFPPDTQKNAEEKIGEIFEDIVEKAEEVYSNIPSPLPTPTPGSGGEETDLPTGQAGPPDSSGDLVKTDEDFVVKPYLIYPVDKTLATAYEGVVNSYLKELRAWYKGKVGKTFRMMPLQVIKSQENYLTMRCGKIPSQKCKDDPAVLEGRWDLAMSRAIHNGLEQWEEKTAAYSTRMSLATLSACRTRERNTRARALCSGTAATQMSAFWKKKLNFCEARRFFSNTTVV